MEPAGWFPCGSAIGEATGSDAFGADAGLCRLDRWYDPWQFVLVTDEKLQKLRSLLRSYERCIVAYSGGVDSTFLAYVAWQVLGNNALAVIADTPSLPRRELDEALQFAQRLGFAVRVVKTHEFGKPDYIVNLPDRCYHCKSELLSVLVAIAQAERFNAILYGENASDTGDFRPGSRAATEFGAHAPLKEVGLTKTEIRRLSARLGLPTADKPQMACLSSRVPYGEPLTPEKLAMIEAAETVLRELGFRDVRVRHHEFRSSVESASRLTVEPAPAGSTVKRLNGSTNLARIEVGRAEMEKFVDTTIFARVVQALKKIGYTYVTLDLEGYRTGSLNEVLFETQQSGTNTHVG